MLPPPEPAPDDPPEQAIVSRAMKWGAQIAATTAETDRRQRRADGTATVLTLAAGRVDWLGAADRWLRIDTELSPGSVVTQAHLVVAAALAAATILEAGAH